MKRAFIRSALLAGLGLLSLMPPADARMGGGGFGGHMGGGGFGGHVGGMGGFGHLGGMGGFGPRMGSGFVQRGPAFGPGRAAFVGGRPFGPRVVQHPFARHAFVRNHRVFRNRFAFGAFPFVTYAASYDNGCWIRVWTPYGPAWRNYCGYDWY